MSDLGSVAIALGKKQPFMHAGKFLSLLARVADGARRYVSRSAHEVVVEQLPETFSTDDPNRVGEVYGDPEALRLAMKELPRGQRHAIEMLKLREMSLKEAAAVSGMSVAALKVAVHRGMNTLRRVLRAKV